MLKVGQSFAHFEVLQKLGEGGMGAVYLVQDQKLNRKAAIKILHSDYFDDKERKERFVREAQTAAQISHPNVMGIYDIGTSTSDGKEFSYIVLEYVSGRSLSDLIRKEELSLKELIRAAEKIASGLAAAHSMNIVHRDIKADNIILTESGEPKILDFGLAKPAQSISFEGQEESTKTVSQELTKVGKIIGTVSYMSPEQARGEKVDIRSDVFSFGILLYRMFTGVFPFEGPTQVSTLAKILESNPEPPSLKNESIPPELERIIAKCLQKDTADRYQGTSDLAVDLRRVRRELDSGITEAMSSITSTAARSAGIRKKGLFKGANVAFMALFGILVISLALVATGMFSNSDGIGTVQASENSLAIISFENKTGDPEYDWLKTGLPEILLTDLASVSSLNIISQERILDCFPDRKTSHTHEECVSAAQSLGASKLLTGSFYRIGKDKIRIDARLEDVATGNIILTEKVVGTDPFLMVDSLTYKLASSLNISDLEELPKVTLYTSSSEQAYKHYIIGMQQFLEHRWDECRTSFRKAIEIDSTFAMPYMRIGMSYAFENRTQQGIEYFRMARQYENKLPQRDRNLLDIYTDIWLEQELDDAFTKMEVFVKNYPNDKEGRAIYGILIYQFQRDSARAFAQLDTALQLDPLYLMAHMFSLGIAVRNQNIEKAVEIGQLIKKFYPDSPLAYDELAGAYKLQGRYDDAINEYKQMHASFPSNAGVLRDISNLFIIKRQLDSAEYYLARQFELIQDDPYELRLYYEAMSNLEMWKGRILGAIDLVKAATEQARETGDSGIIQRDLVLTSRHYFQVGDVDSSLHYARLSHDWAPVFNRLHYPFMLLDRDHSRRDEALRIFKEELPQARSKFPSDMLKLIDALEMIFMAYYNADTAAAIAATESLEEIQNSGPSSGNIWKLATLYVKYGEYAKGKEKLISFVDGIYQSSSGYRYLMSHYYLGICNEGLGLKDEAVANYSEVLRYWDGADVETKEIKDTRKRLANLIT